jgi:hypothetical protein
MRLAMSAANTNSPSSSRTPDSSGQPRSAVRAVGPHDLLVSNQTLSETRGGPLAASVVYAFYWDWRRAVYWFAALTLTVTI